MPACIRLYVISRKYMEYYARKVNGLVILVSSMTNFLVLARVAVVLRPVLIVEFFCYYIWNFASHTPSDIFSSWLSCLTSFLQPTHGRILFLVAILPVTPVTYLRNSAQLVYTHFSFFGFYIIC